MPPFSSRLSNPYASTTSRDGSQSRGKGSSSCATSARDRSGASTETAARPTPERRQLGEAITVLRQLAETEGSPVAAVEDEDERPRVASAESRQSVAGCETRPEG